MNKRIITAFAICSTAILITACGHNSKKDSTSSKTESSKVVSDKSSSKKNPGKDQEVEELGNLISTWQGENNSSINFGSDGSYTLKTNNTTVGGTYKIAGKYDQTVILKMANFNSKTPGLDTYVFVDFQKSKKISFGDLGTFTSLNKPEKIPVSLYLPNSLTEKTSNVSDLIIGTWSNQGSGDHVYVTTNYNPDGTFESFSDASGMVRKGRYSLTSNKDKIEITSTTDGQAPNKITYSVNKAFTEMTFREPGIVYVYKKLNLSQN